MINKNKGFTLIELIIVIAILGIIALIAIPNLAGIRQRAQVSADIRTAEAIGKAIRIWQTDSDAANGELRTIPKGTDTNPIIWYGNDVEGVGFHRFVGVNNYISAGFKAKSMSKDATYFISSIGTGTNDDLQKVIVGIDELKDDNKTPKSLAVPSGTTRETVVNYKGDGTCGWAYLEQ